MQKIIDKIKEAREGSKARKFTQTWDFSVNLKGLNLKKPENRFNFEFMLPEGRGKDLKVVFVADTLESEARKHADLVIKKAEIPGLVKNKKKLKINWPVVRPDRLRFKPVRHLTVIVYGCG
ncbi:hypothetical protein ACFLQO_01530 [Candidatus Aenigmatarchaeota archaeon]